MSEIGQRRPVQRIEKAWPIRGAVSSLLFLEGRVYAYACGECEWEERVVGKGATSR